MTEYKEYFPGPLKRIVRLADGMGKKCEWLDERMGYLLSVEGKYFSADLLPNFPLNTAMARSLCKDKSFTLLLLQKNGILITEGEYLMRPEGKYQVPGEWQWEIVLDTFLASNEWPLVVKPNRGSKGEGCSIVFDRDDLVEAVYRVWKDDFIALVQKYYSGREQRWYILDGEILMAYEKAPDFLVGDGVNSLEKLVEKNNVNFDWRYINYLGYRPESILEAGKKISIKMNANLSDGGEVVKIDVPIDDAMRDSAKKVSEVIGTRYCGVDVLLSDDGLRVIEVNADPGVEELAKIYPDLVDGLIKKVLEKCFD